MIQNTAERLILRRDRRSSATVMLHALHNTFLDKETCYVYTSFDGL